MSWALRALRLALAFLTIARVPIRDDEITPRGLADARLAYPVVGALIGLALAALSEGLRAIGAPPGLSAFLLVATGLGMTGGLHLDGVADTADGLFLWGDPGRRLAVMRDPRVGSFGAVALILVILGKYAALGSLVGPGRSLALLGASAVARSLILVSAGLAPYARAEGTGRVLIDATTPRDAALGSVLAGGVGLATAGLAGLIAASGSIGLALVLTWAARRKLGGVTGDTLGALVELGEVVFLAALGLLSGR